MSSGHGRCCARDERRNSNERTRRVRARERREDAAVGADEEADEDEGAEAEVVEKEGNGSDGEREEKGVEEEGFVVGRRLAPLLEAMARGGTSEGLESVEE